MRVNQVTLRIRAADKEEGTRHNRGGEKEKIDSLQKRAVPQQGLRVTGSELHIDANRKAHNTASYISKFLILRRGQGFDITLICNTIVKAEDTLQFTARLVTSKGTSLLEYNFSDSTSLPANSWGAQRGENGSTSITLTFSTPFDAVIGRYNLLVQTKESSTQIGEIIVLFNPWIRDDIVYMEDQAQRQEYVLTEFGLIYMGTPEDPIPVPWDYGQFQDRILDISLAALDSTLSFERDASNDVKKRNDPLYLCRVLSSIINSNDDNGVVIGNWSADYSGGTNPTAWTGSSKILKSWYPGKKPVKYGQCWVFAGVACTVSRALGLPCRVITNYLSAHDSNNNLTIESFYDPSGEPVNKSDDSIWNFHCWNESWFRRTDLGESYSGWQVWDSTPQEMSGGIFQLGPTSKYAVKEGEVDKLYDTRFVFAEVNADVVNKIVQSDGSLSTGSVEIAAVGKRICTKAVGQKSMNDITLEYKYGEGTPNEREIVNKARNFSNRRSRFVSLSAASVPTQVLQHVTDVCGEMMVSGKPKVGDDVTVNLTLKNVTSEKKKVTVNLNASAVVYTRAVRRHILTNSAAVLLGPNEVKQIPLQLTYAQYEKALTTDNMILVTCVCQVENCGYLFVEANLALENPSLQLQALRPASLGQSVPVEVTFTNPLSNPVKNCVLTTEGSGLTKESVQRKCGALKPAEKISFTMDILPYMDGEKHLVFHFSCDKFNDIKGFLSIDVQCPGQTKVTHKLGSKK
ncbi:protein-glutamine gamma-glutamyltransferase E-like [Rhinophrynus dorsalis]